jgi:hypothetical protein
MDIVERLRRLLFKNDSDVLFAMGDAADEIERLRLDVAEMTRGYNVACQAGITGARDQGVCDLCCGERVNGGKLSTIEITHVHEGGLRAQARIICPRCSGTGADPEYLPPPAIVLQVGDTVFEVGGDDDDPGPWVKVQHADGRVTKHEATPEQAREMGSKLYQEAR